MASAHEQWLKAYQRLERIRYVDPELYAELRVLRGRANRLISMGDARHGIEQLRLIHARLDEYDLQREEAGLSTTKV